VLAPGSKHDVGSTSSLAGASGLLLAYALFCLNHKNQGGRHEGMDSLISLDFHGTLFA